MEDKIEVGEVWKDIKGYEGLYKVSNLGRIKSIQRKVKYQNSERNVNERIKKTFVGNQGYERVELSKDGKNKKYSVHRLVANAFLDEINDNLEVNYIDGNKLNNCIKNLEWCTRSQNERHAYYVGLAKNTQKQRETVKKYCHENKIKPIIQLDVSFNFIKEWKSATEVEKTLGIGRKNISQCITGRSKTAGGYVWVTKEQFESVKYKV